MFVSTPVRSFLRQFTNCPIAPSPDRNKPIYASDAQIKHFQLLVHQGEKGSPSTSNGGHGEIAISAILVNAIPVVMRARPGLRNMADIGLIPFSTAV